MRQSDTFESESEVQKLSVKSPFEEAVFVREQHTGA
jgi:hypothetical protein